MRKLYMVLCLIVLTLGICGCGSAQSFETNGGKAQSMAAFQRVSSDEAAKEYADGHIPNAINIPNESINTTPPKELPDKAQKIFVYCRSGARSQQAAQKLADMGYTNIVEMGGINNWHGDVVK